MTYKGHQIDKYSSILQDLYVLDGDTDSGYWSVADAKRAINGKPVLFQPVSVSQYFDLCNNF